MPPPKPVVLMILDGWGQRPPAADNAIALAATPHWDQLVQTHAVCELTTHGLAVGLPAGQMGNSEVGHMNIGAGRVVYQDLTRISKAISDGEFQRNTALCQTLSRAKTSNATLHIMGLLSPGGVHSHEDHFFALIELALAQSVSQIALHIFTDGRDVAPRCALESLKKLQPYLSRPEVFVASVSGRYFAMDRDRRWDRTERAWKAITQATAAYHAPTAEQAVLDAYRREQDDEFIEPTVIGASCVMKANDVGVFINFRSDRARQLTHALVDQHFDGFDRGHTSPLKTLTTMTTYEETLPCAVAFPNQRLSHVLGEVVASAGKAQLRLAETEKYAHVTYFFNGGEDTVFPNEDRILVPSPKVATYDLQPEMSAPALTEILKENIESQKYDLIVVNLANPDMVGHTGRLDAAIQAVEAVDRVIGELIASLQKVGGEAIITADHGNAEQMLDPATGQAHTAHTTNTVPLIYVGPRSWSISPTGSLRDIAPTLLMLLDIRVPTEMTGTSLLHAHKI